MDIYLANSMRREQLAHQLIQMAAHYSDFGEILQTASQLFLRYDPAIATVHQENSSQLREIIAEIGWPTRSKVGDQASDAAWLIAQHSIGEPAFMKGCYTLMQICSPDINPANLAYLHDQICYFEGRAQRYGTQYDGEFLCAVETIHSVNSLRADLQLPPLPSEAINTIYRSDKGPVTHSLHTDTAFNEWQKKVGWI